MSRIQLALNVDDLDEVGRLLRQALRHRAGQGRPGYANFAVAEPPLKLVLIENPGQGGSHQPPRRRGRGRRHASTPSRPGSPSAGLGVHRRARHDLLLRQAGQVLGRGRPERRALGGLHRPRRQPDVRRRRHPDRRGLLLSRSYQVRAQTQCSWSRNRSERAQLAEGASASVTTYPS